MVKNILAKLKKQPMTRMDLVDSFPIGESQLVNYSLNQLIISEKVKIGGNGLWSCSGGSKMKNVRTKVDGLVFMSKKESVRYAELVMLEKAREIKNLNIQVPYVVSDKVIWGKKVLKEIKYVADFEYYENNKKIVEDTKGYLTPLYRLKRSLFVNRYPEIEFRES